MIEFFLHAARTCVLKRLVPWLIFAATAPALASHQANELQVDDAPKINLKGHLTVYRDPTGHRTIEDIADPTKDLFNPIQGSLSEGFTTDTVWVGFTLASALPESTMVKWLEVSQPLLFNATLYRKNADGRYVEVEGILNQAITPNQHKYRKSIFEIRLDNRLEQTFYLRMQSPSSISTELIIWEPGRFVAYSTAHRFFWGSAYGAYVLVIIFYTAFSIWTRERIHLLYASYIMVLCMASFYSGAWPLQFFPDGDVDWFFRMLGFWISLSPPLAMVFSFAYLNLQGKWLVYSRAITGVATISSICSVVLILSGRYVFAMPFLQVVAMTVISLSCAIAMIHSAKGNSNARMFLFAFSFFYLGASIRLLKNIGLLEPSFLTENGYQIGTFIHMLVMSGAIFSLYTRMRKDKLRAEYRLQDEINLRNQQADFMAMVSHEFRTPLTIISASAENLLNAPNMNANDKARVDKIIRANHRMAGLMQDYLNHERLLTQATSLSFKPIELGSTLQRAIQNFSETAQEPELILSIEPLMVMADKEMIEMVVYNLLSNAIRYAPGYQPVVHCRKHAHWAEFSVFNEGEGIPEQDLPHIFKKFFRGKNSSGTAGSGLGLYLIRSIIEKHNGHVFARNLSKGGCEFVVRLPLTDRRQTSIQ